MPELVSLAYGDYREFRRNRRDECVGRGSLASVMRNFQEVCLERRVFRDQFIFYFLLDIAGQ
jgi:hypothetical protein